MTLSKGYLENQGALFIKKLIQDIDADPFTFEDISIDRKNEFVEMSTELTDLRLYSANMQNSKMEIIMTAEDQAYSFKIDKVDFNFTVNYDLHVDDNEEQGVAFFSFKNCDLVSSLAPIDDLLDEIEIQIHSQDQIMALRNSKKDSLTAQYAEVIKITAFEQIKNELAL